MKKVYKLTAALKDNLWGGTKLERYGKRTDSDRIAESWELSFTKGGEAKTQDGKVMSEEFPREYWGKACEKFEFFPVLTKFIDAREKLSVQVHPSDEYALANEGQYGKTEMWYIVEAEEGAGIYLGLKGKCDKESFSAAVNDGTVEELLSFVKVKAGEVYFIPAGTVHAIGAGVVIYEIQQNSTLTYRLYDYMRRDKDGNLRELHVDKAMLVSLLDEYKSPIFDTSDKEVIGTCKYFETRKCELKCTNRRFFVDKNSFLALTCVRGNGLIEGEKISAGDTYFCPAGAGEIELCGDMTVIAVSMPFVTK